MAEYKVQAPDGSIIRLEGPADATAEQIGQAAQAAYAAKQASAPAFDKARQSYTKYGEPQAAPPGQEAPLAVPRAGTPAGTPRNAGEVESVGQGAPPPETTLAGVGGAAERGLMQAGPAIIAGGVAGPVGAGLVAGAQFGLEALIPAMNAKLGTNIQTPSQAIEALADMLGVPKPQTALERILQAGVSTAAGAGNAIMGGKALQASGNALARNVGGFLSDQPVAQLAGALGSGTAAQTTAEAGGGEKAQLAASLAGGILGSHMARTSVVAPPNAAAASQTIAAAEREGIPIMTSDVNAPKTFAGKWLQQVGEKIPLAGTGGLREEQQASRIKAIQNIGYEYAAENPALTSQHVMEDLIKTHGAELTKLVNEKKAVINSAAQSGGVLPVTRATAAINQQIAKLKNLKTEQVGEAVKVFEDWKTAIQGQTIDNVEDLRAMLGETLKTPGLANVSTLTEKASKSIYGALRDDMGEFIKQNTSAADHNKWQVANKKLSTMIRETKITPGLKQALNMGTDRPEIIDRLIFSQKPSDVRVLYRKLSPEGQANMRSSIMAKAIADAGGMERPSPEKFLSKVKSLSTPFGVAYSGADEQRLRGLSRALDATRRAGEAALSPATGVQNVLPVLAAGLSSMLGSLGATAATAAGVGVSARLYESAAVRNILLRLPHTAVNSAEEGALLRRLAVALQASENTKTPEQEQK